MDTLKAHSIPTADRPDVSRKESKPKLTFKEVKDCLFKFLMQAGVKFTDPEILTISAPYKPTEEEEFNLERGYYTSCCRLMNIKVDKKPVHIIVLSEKYDELENRQKNKILFLKKTHKIVIFDAKDWKDIGLNISDREWLSPLTKGQMKTWARKLFNKIGDLGKVESDLTLNDLYEAIEKNTSPQLSRVSRINALEKEVLILKQSLRKKTISDSFVLKESHDRIIELLSLINEANSVWIEETVSFITQDILSSIDLRQNKYKDSFRLKNGKINPADKDKLTGLITLELERRKPNLSVTNLGYGLLEIQNKKTFQVVTVAIVPSVTSKIGVIELKPEAVKQLKTPLVFTLGLHFNQSNYKIDNITGDVIAVSHCANFFKYDKDYRLPVFDSTQHKNYSLWTIRSSYE